MSLKIGQVAKLLDLPVETIRFYEKNQILSPGRKENSSYREYEVWEVFDLFECLGYRGLGFSVKDVKKIMKDASLEEISDMLNSRILHIKEQEQLLEMQTKELNELRQSIRTAKYNIGRYWVEYTSRRLYVNCVYNVDGQYEDVEFENELLRKWIGKAPFVKAGLLIDPEQFQKERVRMQWIQSIKEENLTYADLNIEEVDGCSLEEGMCLTTILDLGERGTVTPDLFFPSIEYAGQSGYRIAGKYYGELFLRNYEEDGWHRYMKLMIPIQEN